MDTECRENLKYDLKFCNLEVHETFIRDLGID